jgi:phospholipid N-methyltransferase
MTATYSPEDNKLRLYPVTRLPKDLYDRVKAAGFIWAPKQELFVAPKWTPDREDLLIELCGEVGDEDTSLVDRAAQRAERFEEYSEKRAEDADRAHAGVSAIADNIPLGQPILVGHHSERRARKDAEKIQDGMRRAVKMWETSKYWEDRAQGARAHANYKEHPGVRQRRIKGLEAEKRGMERTLKEVQREYAFWSQETITHEQAFKHCNSSHYCSMCWPLAEYPREKPASQYEGDMSLYSALDNRSGASVATVEQVKARVIPRYEAHLERVSRWILHYNNRINYERAMLQEQGGTAADKFQFEVGGRILRRGSWYVIAKINKREGVVNSVSVFGHFASTVGVDEIQDYEPPKEGVTAKVKKLTATVPICNYPAETVVMFNKYNREREHDPAEKVYEITQAQWDSVIAHQEHKGTQRVAATKTHGAHRLRVLGSFRLRQFGHVTKSQWGFCPVYITDAKRKDPPPPDTEPMPTIVSKEQDINSIRSYVPPVKSEDDLKFDGLKQTLKAGVQVVSAPQLFPTPPELAKRVVELLEFKAGQRILEPSAGTGRLLNAIHEATPLHEWNDLDLVAVEVDRNLANRLDQYTDDVRCADFLECNGDLGLFDRIVMNPPFANGQDIKHIQHATKFLKPGGRLVAICANGSRQKEILEPLAEQWIDLPPDSFKESGTSVNAAIVVIQK